MPEERNHASVLWCIILVIVLMVMTAFYSGYYSRYMVEETSLPEGDIITMTVEITDEPEEVSEPVLCDLQENGMPVGWRLLYNGKDYKWVDDDGAETIFLNTDRERAIESAVDYCIFEKEKEVYAIWREVE